MPLPTGDKDDRTPWPLPGQPKAIVDEMAEHAAWFSGSTERLRTFYGNADMRTVTKQQWWNRFYRRRGVQDPLTGSRLQVHVPLAGDIAAMSADLLFSEAPSFEFEDASEGEANESTAAQDRLTEIVEEGALQAVFLEMAETGAAIGGSYLRPVWDKELMPDRPLLTVVQADQAVPDFRFGILTAVTFHTELGRDGNMVIRHLERHEKGVIYHAVYEGTTDTLGIRIPLTEREETKDLAASLTDGDRITIDGLEGLLVRYVPNVRPNRRHRNSTYGRSDFQGIESLFDALDETYTSWIRDIRLGKRRILVASEFLDRTAGKPEQGAWFDADREVFTPLDMEPGAREGSSGIEIVDFEIRAEAHETTATAIVREAVSKAGYAAQSFIPRFEGEAESGTALKLRERKSFQTKAKKELYVKTQLADVAEILLFIDSTILGHTEVPVLRPSVSLADSIAEGVGELAETASALLAARAASTETRVRLVHPDWNDDIVSAEVARILDEEGTPLANLLPGDEPNDEGGNE